LKGLSSRDVSEGESDDDDDDDDKVRLVKVRSGIRPKLLNNRREDDFKAISFVTLR